MNVLTKICVVILVILVLLATPVFIHQSVMIPNYKQAYEGQRLRNQALHMDAKHKTLALQRAMADIEALTRRTNTSKETLERDIQDRIAENTRLQGEIAGLQADITKFNSELTALRKSHEENVKRRELLTTHLGEARAQIDKLNGMNRSLEEMLKATQADVERLTKVSRVRLEQITEKDEQIRELTELLEAAKAGGPATAAGKPDMPAPSITGTVDSVRGDLVGINIGAAKGIKPGMKLIVFRGTNFVAHLRIQEVDVNQAAGVLADKQLDPMPGDKVTTSLN